MRRSQTAILFGSVLLLAACEQPQTASTPAAAQPAAGPSYSFRLAPARNPGGCSRLDTALSREHTVTVSGATAIVKSAGGVDDVARQVSPGVYATNFSLANVRLDVTADLSKSPKTLVVVEKNAGCRWQGQAA